MTKLFVLMGKSASGKDTIYQKLFEDENCEYKKIIPYTTRPIRQGEENGKEYFFVSIDQFMQLKHENKIVEYRQYETVFGTWYYFTANDDQINFKEKDTIMISTLEGYVQIRDFFGADKVIPIYIEVDDFVRLQRSLEREKRQKVPSCAEVCRRFLADERDFAEEKLRREGILNRIPNNTLEDCMKQVVSLIKKTR